MRTDMPANHHIFQRSHLAKQPDILESTGNPCLGNLMRCRRRIRLARKMKAATVRLIQTCNNIEEGCFACTVRTDQTVDLPSPNTQMHIRQSLQTTETFRSEEHTSEL